MPLVTLYKEDKIVKIHSVDKEAWIKNGWKSEFVKEAKKETEFVMEAKQDRKKKTKE